MEWFSTRAQIIQTVCSGISGIGAAIAIVGLIAHSRLPSPKLVLYLSLTILFLAVLFFTRRLSIPFLRDLIPPPLCGSVELLTVRTDLSDRMSIDPKTWEYSADFGVFCRMSVTANRKPRTVKKFTMEIRLMKDGKAQEPPAYVADSERTIGDFLYRYSKDSLHGLEFVVEKDIYEEMSDLASRLLFALARNKWSIATELLFEDEELPQQRQRRDPVLPARSSESAQAKKLTHQTADGLPVQSFTTLLSDLASRARVTYTLKSDKSGPTFQQVPPPTPLQARAHELLNPLSVSGN